MTHSGKRSPRRWRLIAALVVAVALGLAVTATAGATLYTAKISPTAAEAGSSATYTVTLRNLLGPRMGSANVQIPADWTDASVGTPTVLKVSGAASDRVWTAQLVGSTLELRADGTGNANKAPILWSVEVSVTVTAPCAEGVSIWETAAKTGSEFTGHSFIRIGPKPKVTVSGSCDVIAQTVLDTTPGVPASGENCSDATSEIPSCVGVNLPLGANGQISLVTGTPDLGPEPEGGIDDVITSILGDFKYPDGHEFAGDPIYTQDDPATAILEYDSLTLPSCPDLDRALLGEYYEYGDYYPYRDSGLLTMEPRTCLELFVKFTDEGDWHSVPVCAVDGGEGFEDVPFHTSVEDNEVFWYDEELEFGSLFDDDGDEGLDSGACMAASHFDDEGDLVLYVLFFGDPHFGKR